MDINNILYLIIYLVSFIGIDFIYFKFIKEFPIKIWMHLISIVVPSGMIFYLNTFSIETFCYCTIMEILIILGFTDVLHFEISKNSYWLLLALCYASILLTTSGASLFDAALSPIVMYFVFWVFDHLFGIEKLGGADVKLMLILSFYFDATELFQFVILVFGFCAFLFFIYAFIKMKFRRVQVPMIVGIALGFIVQGYLTLSFLP